MSLCEKINNANALGRQNLTDKGVEVSADATTYEIMQSIADIVIGGGGSSISYTDIVYNDDNTITLTDTDGTEHTMVCEYTDGKLTSLKFDGKSVALKYEGDVLISVGGVSVDVSNAQVSGGTEELETLIDESGVLDTEGTVSVTEKVEQLIDKADVRNALIEHLNTTTYLGNTSLFQSYSRSYLPQIDYSKKQYMNNYFAYAQIESFDYYINSSVATSTSGTFRGMNKLKYMVGVDLANSTNVMNIFSDDIVLEEIQKPLTFAKATNLTNVFLKCYALKDIKFVKETIKVSISFVQSSLLSAESIQSIIDGLATVTTAQTLTLNANAKILQSQVDSANAKGWTIAGGTVVSEEEYYG